MNALLRWRDLLGTDGVQVGQDRDADHLERWGDGPWLSEPDRVSWVDPTTERPCLVTRHEMGYLCGYVAVDPGHPLHQADSDKLDSLAAPVDYSDFCQTGPGAKVCHVPAPGKPADVWWFGFHSGHYNQLTPMFYSPMMRNVLGAHRTAAPWEVYQGMARVITQVQALALELARLVA